MLDQSFSSSNFNLIFLKENRKGNIKKRYLDDSYFEKHNEFLKVLDEKNALKKSRPERKLSKEESEEFAKKLKNINKEKEDIRNNLFSEYSEIVNDEVNLYSFDIKYDNQNKIYTSSKDGVSFFTMKQLQKNIHKTFDVIQADRNKIIKQVYNLISDGFPKVVVRTDVKKFYESIPQEKLFEKIFNNTLLSPLSKKFLRRLFYEFEMIKDSREMLPKKGIPRGFGISAYLSELYMREIDNEIKSLPDVIYFARYVDDIIVVFSPKTKSQIQDYQSKIKKIINKYHLEIRDGSDNQPSKTFTYELLESTLPKLEKLTFLGYTFVINKNHSVKIELSCDKLKRYITRIKLSIEAYNKDSKYDEKRARKMLSDRFKFLIGNYHLNHNKKNIKAGIFYSNQMLSLNTAGFSSLNTLNKIAYNEFTKINPPPNIGIDKSKLIDFLKGNFCFKRGFEDKEKYFFSFKFNRKEQSYYQSKFKRYTNKFEVIKSIWINE